MKLAACVLFLAVSAVAQRPHSPQAYPSLNEVPIISYVNENNYDGSFRYSYETGNGISVQEDGVLKNPGHPELEAQTANGRYSYTAPDGQVITVTWYADETGFHAESAYIATRRPVTVPSTTPRPSPAGPSYGRPSAGSSGYRGKK